MHMTRRHLLKSLGFTAAGSSFVSFLPASLHGESPRLAADQPRSTPEAQGIPSSAILDFLTALEKQGGERHSIMLARHGKVITEGWWAPYAQENKHWLYSLSKSFASTAVGIAAAEGKLSVDDLVTKHFPDDLPKTVSDNLTALRIKDLLSMLAIQRLRW
jgi:CubicO group peptidase (beta-lactamase class C family)